MLQLSLLIVLLLAVLVQGLLLWRIWRALSVMTYQVRVLCDLQRQMVSLADLARHE